MTIEIGKLSLYYITTYNNTEDNNGKNNSTLPQDIRIPLNRITTITVCNRDHPYVHPKNTIK